MRTYADIFYENEIIRLNSHFWDFKYFQYFSRESNIAEPTTKNQKPTTLQGYVTDWITPENISKYEEFYLCGSPAMVKDARAKLEILGIEKERIFWEQF